MSLDTIMYMENRPCYSTGHIPRLYLVLDFKIPPALKGLLNSHNSKFKKEIY